MNTQTNLILIPKRTNFTLDSGISAITHVKLIIMQFATVIEDRHHNFNTRIYILCVAGRFAGRFSAHYSTSAAGAPDAGHAGYLHPQFNCSETYSNGLTHDVTFQCVMRVWRGTENGRPLSSCSSTSANSCLVQRLRT